MGAFGGLKHVDSINFKKKYYHAFQFEQSFWSQILLKICVLMYNLLRKSTSKKIQSKSWPVWLVDCSCGLLIAFEHYTSKNVTCNDLSITLLVPCILFVSDEWRCTQPGLLQTMRPKNFMSCNWALTRADRSFDTQRLCFSPSSIECQQRSLITPLIYRLIRLWRNANEPSSAMPCLPYIKVITM